MITLVVFANATSGPTTYAAVRSDHAPTREEIEKMVAGARKIRGGDEAIKELVLLQDPIGFADNIQIVNALSVFGHSQDTRSD